MLSTSTRLLIFGMSLFVVGTALVFLGIDTERARSTGLGVGTVCLSVLSLALGARFRRDRGTPLQLRTEQHLWRSGPLGRMWLKARKRLP